MARLSVPIPLKQIEWAMNIAMASTGFVLVGVCAIAVSLLLDPLMAEFHWSNGAASGLATTYSLAAMLSGPVAGVVIDRIGSKIVMTGGVALVALGFFGLSWCSTLVGFHAAFGLIGVGYGGAFYLASTKIIATRMGAQKNLAMGIWMGAGSVGAAAFSVLVNWSIRGYGWRSTAVAAALLILAMIPVILFVIPRDTTRDSDLADAAHGAHGMPPMKMLVAPEFLLMTAVSALAAFGMSAIYFHTVPILLKAGFSSQSASAVFGASWVVSGVGSLAAGAVANHAGTRNVLAGSLLLGAIGTVALLAARDTQSGMVAVIAFVALWGATANAINQFLPLLLVERFGSTHLGALVGVQGALMGVVGSLAPIVTGTLYDRYSNYGVSITTSAFATLLALILMGLLKRTSSDGVEFGPTASAAPDH